MWTRWVTPQWAALCHSNPVDHHGSSAPFCLQPSLDSKASRSQHETTGGTRARAEAELLPWSGRAPSQLPGDPATARRGGGGWQRGARVSKPPEDLLTLDPVTLMLRHSVQQHVPAPPTHVGDLASLYKADQQRNTNAGSQRAGRRCSVL